MRTAVLLVLAVVLGLGACSSEAEGGGGAAPPSEGRAEGASTETPALGASDGPTTTSPYALPARQEDTPFQQQPNVVDRIPVPPAVVAVIGAFLNARENAVSASQATPSSWLDQAAKVMTPEMLDAYRARAALFGSGGEPFRVAHQMGLSVKTDVDSCTLKTEGTPRPPYVFPSNPTVVCKLTNTTVDAAGAVVPKASLPFGWPYNGVATPPPVIELTNASGSWLVKADHTGA